MMKNVSFGALVTAFAVLGGSGLVQAQDMSFDLEEAETPTQETTETADEGDAIGDLALSQQELEGDREQAANQDEAAEEIFAVQQIYTLRLNRLELAPSFVATMNDPFVFHRGIGVSLNYWWTNVLAIGANFIWYQGFENESDLNFFTRRSTRLAIPITEWQMGAHLNFTYVPIFGKFMMFNRWIFQWDAYIIGGVGMQRTRPVPVIDPEVRFFDYGNRVAFNVGLGIRIFLSRFLAFYTEFRNYMYLEKHENTAVSIQDREDPANWLASPDFTSNMSVQIGLSVFFPFTFDYRLPR